MPSLVAMTSARPGAAPPAAEPHPTGFPTTPATPAPWPALAGDPERAPVADTPPTGRWPDLPDDGEQRARRPASPTVTRTRLDGSTASSGGG